MAPLSLAAEITLTVVGLEKCPDCSVAIESEERPALPVVTGDCSITADNFLDVTSNRPIAELLRLPQILGLGYSPKLPAVFREMLVELLPGAEADSRVRGIRGCRRLRLC